MESLSSCSSSSVIVPLYLGEAFLECFAKVCVCVCACVRACVVPADWLALLFDTKFWLESVLEHACCGPYGGVARIWI